eukprot:jgi/Botrbrau1/9581/Bobra.106_2s0005.2
MPALFVLGRQLGQPKGPLPKASLQNSSYLPNRIRSYLNCSCISERATIQDRQIVDLLSWLTAARGAEPGDLKCKISQLNYEGGRGLVATEDINPEDLLLSIPFTTIFEDKEVEAESAYPWSGRMALRLLHERRYSSRSATASSL